MRKTRFNVYSIIFLDANRKINALAASGTRAEQAANMVKRQHPDGIIVRCDLIPRRAALNQANYVEGLCDLKYPMRMPPASAADRAAVTESNRQLVETLYGPALTEALAKWRK